MFAYFYLENRKEREIYHRILRGVLDKQTNIKLESVSKNNLQNAVRAMLTDNPQVFWFEGKVSVKEMPGSITIIPHYKYTCPEIQTASEKLSVQVSEIFKDVGNDSFEQAKALYEWLLNNVSYSTEASGQNIYEALVEKKAVCKGLSKAYQYLLSEINVFSTLREGTIDGRTRHIWNVVGMNGSYYNVDVSLGYKRFDYLFESDDINDRYRAFLKSDQNFSRIHRLWDSEKMHLSCPKDFKEN